MKKALSFALALAMCLGLTVPAMAAGKTETVTDKEHGLSVTLHGFLWKSTFKCGTNESYEVYVVEDNSSITVEALPGYEYASWGSPDGQPIDFDVFEGLDDAEFEKNYAHTNSWYGVYFLNDKETGWGGPDQDAPLSGPYTRKVVPTDADSNQLNLIEEFSFSVMCKSDYARMAPDDKGPQQSDDSKPTTPTVPSSFSDVKAGDWYKTYVDKVTEAGLMTGVGDGKFSPKGHVTTAELLVLAYQIHSKANGGTLPEVSGAWYMPYYEYCMENARPMRVPNMADMGSEATRLDVVSILHNAIPSERMVAVKDNITIPDVKWESYPQVYTWYQAGIISGDPQGNFNGNNSITRAEMAVILCQINNLV